MYEWVARARQLARYDRNREIELYRTLPRNADGKIVWNALEPLGRAPWHAPLFGVSDIEPRVFKTAPHCDSAMDTGSTRQDDRRVYDMLLPYRDWLRELREVQGHARALTLKIDDEAVHVARDLYGRGFDDFMDRVDRLRWQLEHDENEALSFVEWVCEPVGPMGIDVSKQQMVVRPPRHLPDVSRIAVDLVEAFVKLQRRPRNARPSHVGGSRAAMSAL